MQFLVKKIVTDSKNMETGGSVSSSVESPSTFMDIGINNYILITLMNASAV